MCSLKCCVCSAVVLSALEELSKKKAKKRVTLFSKPKLYVLHEYLHGLYIDHIYAYIHAHTYTHTCIVHELMPCIDIHMCIHRTHACIHNTYIHNAWNICMHYPHMCIIHAYIHTQYIHMYCVNVLTSGAVASKIMSKYGWEAGQGESVCAGAPYCAELAGRQAGTECDDVPSQV